MARLIAAGVAPEPLRPAERGWPLRVRQATALAALVAGSVYLVWRLGWTGQGASPWTYWPLVVAEGCVLVSLALFVLRTWHVPGASRPPHLDDPTVDVFVVVDHEPLGVVHATLIGCRAIRYPRRTWLLDLGRRPEIESLAASMGVGYRPGRGDPVTRASTVNAALESTDGELILVLGAADVPFPDLLDATVGYFDDPRVAVVQTPQDFANRDSVLHTRADRHEQSLRFEVVAPVEDHEGAGRWYGSAAILRRSALVAVGGVRTATASDDFHTTVALHAAGWRTRYHHQTLVQGLAPLDLRAFLAQRERWARGHLGVMRTRENPVTCRHLTLRQRVLHTASVLDHLSGFVRLALLAVLVVTLATGALPLEADPVVLVGLWSPWVVLAFAARRGLSRGQERTFDASRYGWLSVGAQLRAAGVLVTGRSDTAASPARAAGDPGGLAALRATPLVVVCGIVVAVVTTIRLVVPGPLEGFALAALLALASVQLAQIGWSLALVVGRRQLRRDYRYPVGLPGRVGSGLVRVVDLSVRGAGLMGPVRAELGEPVVLQISVPDSKGEVHDLILPATVRSIRARGEQVLGAGIEFTSVPAWTLEHLVEYLAVVRGAEVVGHAGPRVETTTRPVEKPPEPVSVPGTGALVDLLNTVDGSASEQLRHPEGEIERLPGVEPGIAHRLVTGA
jgi:cellulose synthase (UDP-forming)